MRSSPAGVRRSVLVRIVGSRRLCPPAPVSAGFDPVSVRWVIGALAALLLSLCVGVLPASAGPTTTAEATTTTVEATTTTLAETTTLYPPWTAEDERSHASEVELGLALSVFLLAALVVMRFRS